MVEIRVGGTAAENNKGKLSSRASGITATNRLKKSLASNDPIAINNSRNCSSVFSDLAARYTVVLNRNANQIVELANRRRSEDDQGSRQMGLGR